MYWVCTVVTTVGYGDYSGGTTLEYLFTIMLEFLGMVVFSTLQVAVQQVVDNDSSFAHFKDGLQERVNFWLLSMENSGSKENLPRDLY